MEILMMKDDIMCDMNVAVKALNIKHIRKSNWYWILDILYGKLFNTYFVWKWSNVWGLSQFLLNV